MTVIDILLKNRGLTTPAAIKEFFHPSDPQKIKFSADQAVVGIKRAIKQQRPIYIYGDYDADGITATAVLWEALYRLKAKVMPYICPRNDPVRGLSVAGLKAFPKNSLVITVDNGITAFPAAEYAQKEGIELIITDHHLPRQNEAKVGQLKLPPASAIVHSTDLAGVGVAWFLAREIGDGGGLDLTALGTIADMVPLLGANRSLVKFGLSQLQKTRRPGIKALMALTKTDLAAITPHQVGFSLAPRLNAIGRMADSLDALRLLCTKNPVQAKSLAEKINQVNEERQEKTLTMWEHARRRVKAAEKIIFLADKSYHEGLVGLVAGRLMEEFNRPAFVAAIGPKHVKVSCRSIESFNAIEIIRQLGGLTMEHGGHPLAAGFTAEAKNLPAIKEKLLKAAAKIKSGGSVKPEFDCDLPLEQVNWDFYRQLERFEPFGFGNPQPVFRAKKVKLVSFYPVGADNRHLKLSLQGETLKAFSAIAFGKGPLAAKLTPGQLIDITYSLEANHWNGQKSLELKIKEISF